uniref:Secreted protein n=1 Tax=Hemiselmis tepida TaxID=464990 RepID=A0A7S0VQ72_9CRYP|mmetsp:Transcript_23773/g.60149  ORF Transcript_23773/g.60149 Transcript_23773/m.60149 type:complete len:100 (+) Transcript_23773:1-300(+)
MSLSRHLAIFLELLSCFVFALSAAASGVWLRMTPPFNRSGERPQPPARQMPRPPPSPIPGVASGKSSNFPESVDVSERDSNRQSATASIIPINPLLNPP